MHCLFVKPKLIGDTLLLTPTLEAVRRQYPDAVIDVVVRRGSEAILEGCSAYNRIIATAAPDTDRHHRSLRQTFATLRAVRRQTYDWVFECSDTSRGRYAALAARARHRVFNLGELNRY